MSRRFQSLCIAMLGLAAAAAPSLAQCAPSFVYGDLQGVSGFNGSPFASVQWDPDGPGPQPARLVVAGAFGVYGSTPVNRVCSLDASGNVTVMGTGVGDAISGINITSLAVHNNEVYVGGLYLNNGSSQPVYSVARWDGSAWVSVGGGLASATGTATTVNALISFNGRLIAAGSFLQTGPSVVPTVAISRVAQWDGTSWQQMGNGLTGGTVSALAVHNGELYAGGMFTSSGATSTVRVARFDGANWQPLGNNVAGQNGVGTTAVTAMVSHNGSLFVGGDFTAVTNASGTTTTVNRIARWTGSAWAQVGPFSGTSGGLSSGVNSLLSSNGRLLVGGGFATANNGATAVTVNRIVALDNTTGTWSGFGPTATTGLNQLVRSIVEFNGSIYALGLFSDAGPSGIGPAGVNGARGIARLNTVTGIFDPQFIGGPNNPIWASTYFNGNLVVAGNFNTIGGVAARRVAMFNGTNWVAFGAGLGNPTFGQGLEFDTVLSLGVYNGQLYAGGNFNIGNSGGTVPGAPVCLARWDAISGTWVNLSANNSVYSMVAKDDKFYVGGIFLSVNGVPARNVATFDGTTWSQVGSGINSGSSSAVWSLALYNNDLYVGGAFQAATVVGGTASYLVRFNGTDFEAVGPGLTRDAGGLVINPGVWSMTTYQGKLIVAGRFNRTADNLITDLNSVAAWDGVSFAPVAAGITTAAGNGQLSTVYGLAVSNGTLVATGDFVSTAGNGGLYNRVAYLDAEAWNTIGANSLGATLPVPGGLGNNGRTIITLTGGDILVGGDFTAANNRFSNYSARLSVPAALFTVAVTPATSTACIGAATTFIASISGGTGPFSYNWRRDGVPIDATANPSAATAVLSLPSLLASDAGAYLCIVASGCATVASNTATFTVTPCGSQPCSLADIAGGGETGRVPDGIVDGSDFIAFVNSFSAGDVAIDSLADVAGGGADGLSPDGIIDGSDFIAFINAFAAGC